MGVTDNARPRRRGRPPGGGNSPEQARRMLLETAERCFGERGLRVTMAEIANEAGVTRAVVYRHFAGRDEIVVGVIERALDRLVETTVGHLLHCKDAAELITEALTYANGALERDPIFRVLLASEDSGTVARILSNSAVLNDHVYRLLGTVFREFATEFRPDVELSDISRFILSVGLGIFTGAVPEAGDPDVLRRYIRTFVLPGILEYAPGPEVVFTARPPKVDTDSDL
ncbi:TetR/AcrR family transcriptional regulator [Antrihabitans sp. YC2-6]|uniref:TetR/AcrR family transcriptional regulator n=1 Tax=Antrihabitans sp. YC2-6 TaxID=2799498 RepID=UPI0018F5619B|nr:TetR/AcrR family transcriptional regulator [Antrihabitans sp. YC2-6]MBJ8345217.1 TetR/AcrR family transcriptional regulator [Antrihabitans sp. YC2-6]